MQNERLQVLERGAVYFLYRPKIGEFAPTGLEDVQRFYIIFKPDKKARYRVIVIAEKRLPEVELEREKFWGYVEFLTDNPEEIEEEFRGRVYATQTRGERGQPSGRPVGEGVYELLLHNDHTHFTYILSVPKILGEVQRELGLKEEGNYIISLINPKAPTPPDIEVSREQRANYPEKLQNLFGKRRFIRADKVELLDFPGAAFVLIGVEKEIPQEVGIKLEAETEGRASAQVFNQLKLERSRHRIEPLFRGKWA